MTTFSELYQAHARDVHRFALFLSGDSALAEDIVSETFIRLWHARERVELPTVKAYLLAIARNLFLAHRRQLHRQAELRDEHDVTREVVRDLLTVYLAGDASDDTRALVDEYLAQDAVLKAEADAARRSGPAMPVTPATRTSATAEKRALDETRRLMKTRTHTLVMAVLFTMLPFSFVFNGSRITFVLLRDAPVVAAAWWATAVVMWAWHLSVRRRLAVSGL